MTNKHSPHPNSAVKVSFNNQPGVLPLMINNDHHSVQLIVLDLPPYRWIILWLVCVGKTASRPVLRCSSASGFMNESAGERGVACLMWITLLPERRFLRPPGPGCTKGVEGLGKSHASIRPECTVRHPQSTHRLFHCFEVLGRWRGPCCCGNGPGHRPQRARVAGRSADLHT